MNPPASITPMIDTQMGGFQQKSAQREAVCLSIAVAVHALVFLWNPIILRGSFEKPLNPLVEIGIVEEMAAPASAAPKKMTLLDTLKDMLSKPEPAPAHIEPKTPTPTPLQPALQERVMPRLITNTMKTSTQDELNLTKTPAPITPAQKNFQVPNNTPALTSKTFGGIRAKDLPFETSNETIATSGQSVPISVGKTAAKDTINYSNPTLQNNTRSSLTSKKFVGMGTTEPSSLNSSSAGQIQVNNAAPSIAPSNTPAALRESKTTGGGLINRALIGQHSASPNLQTMPSAAAQLDQQLQSDTANSSRLKKSPSGFEITGKLANRTILKKVIPQYPSWAEEQGLIGTLRLYFTVTPEGAVRANIKVTKTTGNPQLDQIGIDALKEWLFAPQPGGNEEDVQWGIITFTFSLAS